MEVGGSSPLHLNLSQRFFLETNYSRTAAALTALAIKEAFPGSQFMMGGETARGFFCQFVAPFPLPPVARDMLEERMRLIVRENRSIQEMEMVAFSARELMKRERSLFSVDALLDCDPKGLVSVVKIDDFYELMDGPFCPSIRDVGAFKVIAMIDLGELEYRVEGCAFATKVKLKEFLKCFAEYKTSNHLAVGQRLGFWDYSDSLIWQPKGLALKGRLVSFFKESFGGLEYACANVTDFSKFALKQKKPFTAWIINDKVGLPLEGEGLFEEVCQSSIQQKIYCASEELDALLISLLQTIDKTFIILGFHTHVRLLRHKKSEKLLKCFEAVLGKDLPLEIDGVPGARVQWMVLDGLGRQQIALEVELLDDKTCVQMKVRIEKILALLLELSGGRLPKQIQSSCANVKTNSE